MKCFVLTLMAYCTILSSGLAHAQTSITCRFGRYSEFSGPNAATTPAMEIEFDGKNSKSRKIDNLESKDLWLQCDSSTTPNGISCQFATKNPATQISDLVLTFSGLGRAELALSRIGGIKDLGLENDPYVIGCYTSNPGAASAENSVQAASSQLKCEPLTAEQIRACDGPGRDPQTVQFCRVLALRSNCQ